jgi:hypothetical protein
MPRQTTPAVNSRRVARMPAWASSWTILNTSWRSGTGMMGFSWPVDTSQMTCCSCISTLCSCNDVELAAFRVSWHVYRYPGVVQADRTRSHCCNCRAACGGPRFRHHAQRKRQWFVCIW